MLTVIRNAHLVDAVMDMQGSVLLKDGKILAIGSVAAFDSLTEDDSSELCPVIDANGMTLMPAFIDLHVHFRDPGLTYKEDLETGSKAALAGGYTTVNLMANTKPVCDTASKQEDILKRAKALNLIDVYQAQAVTYELKGQELTDIANAKGKFLSDDGKGIMSDELMYRALKAAKQANKIIQVHEENTNFAPDVTGLAEETMLARDLSLVEELDAEIYLCHMSTQKSMEQIKQAKEKGLKVIVEATPHHLALADNSYKVHPPIRQEQDRLALIQGIKDGLVDIIGTDHAPHSEADKENGAPGLVGLETAFSVLYTSLVKEQGISLNCLSKLMSAKGAELLNLNKGRLLPGYLADLVLVDLEALNTIEPSHFHSKSHNTPFAKQKYQGEVVWTMKEAVMKYRKDAKNEFN